MSSPRGPSPPPSPRPPPAGGSPVAEKPHHTFIVSDFHQSDAEPLDPRRPLWKRFRARDLFIDESFARFLEHVRQLGEGSVELILNGDMLDFDSITALPEPRTEPLSWLERRRGLNAEEPKSLFKLSLIVRDHAVFFRALGDFLRDGHRVVFIIGNHDLELHWPSVQAAFREALGVTEKEQAAFTFCEWFMVSGGDTLVEHGNQYDPYCVCMSPVSPLVSSGGKDRVRIPFGNLAGKYMLNGMGLFNPHVESSFILPLRQYLLFFVRYMLRVQPLLAWTWFWSAMATLGVSLREGWLPALRDPFTLEERVDGIAERAHTTPRVVRQLETLHAHPAVFSPLGIVRELWLDRALLLALAFIVTFQLFSLLNVFVSLSIWYWALLFVAALPFVIFYARGVASDVKSYARGLQAALPKAVKLAGVRRAVMGHTHIEQHTNIDGVEVLNTGTWSPAYHDVECTKPYGRKCFAWLRPTEDGRVAELREWRDPISVVVPEEPYTPSRSVWPGKTRN